jgi:hypothetical protein
MFCEGIGVIPNDLSLEQSKSKNDPDASPLLSEANMNESSATIRELHALTAGTIFPAEIIQS